MASSGRRSISVENRTLVILKRYNKFHSDVLKNFKPLLTEDGKNLRISINSKLERVSLICIIV